MMNDPAADAAPESTTPADAGVVVSDAPEASTLLTGGDPAAEPAKDAASDAPEVDGADAAKDQNGAPEVYADFVMPEGVQLDTEAVAQFAPIAKELNLTQEQAQKLVDIEANRVKAQMAAADAQIAEWAEKAKADPEMGGAKWDATIKSAQAAYASVATPELREMLDMTGLGNHPEVVRMFAKLGAQHGLDKTPPTGTNPVGGQRSIEERMYPDLAKR